MIEAMASRLAAGGAFLRARAKTVWAILFYAGERAIFIGLSFLVYALMARTYGAEIFGLYSYAQSIVYLFAPFLALGAEAVLVRELVRRPEERGAILGSAFGMLTLATLGAVLIPIGLIALLRPGDGAALMVGTALALSFVPNAFFVIEHLFKAEVRAKLIATARTIAMGTSAAAKLFLIWREAPIFYVAAAVALETCVLACAYGYFYLTRVKDVGAWRFTWPQARLIASQSVPAMVAAVAVTAFFRISQINLGQFAGYGEVAEYAVAFQIIQVVWMAPTIFFSAVYPRLVQIDAESDAALDVVNRRLLLGFALASYGIAAGLILFGGPILTLTFGPEFANSQVTLAILAASSAFVFSGAVRGRYIFLKDAPIYHLYNTAIGLAVLLPLNWALIPRYGDQGAAMSVAAGLLASAVLSSFAFAKTRAFGRDQISALLLLPLLRRAS
ncbi:MAG: flippase [Pseudomonadota bacterium]